jgi:transforming growth factor-beta-induced protein
MAVRRRLQIRRVNLLQILSDPGDFTFFAPTNNAFALLPQELLELLYLRDAFIPHLEDLLRYHALNGKRFVADFFSIEIIPAFNMEGLLVREDPFLVNGIPVVRTNINASNGVTHVLNGVLKPNWVDNSILGFVASSMTDLSILFELLERAGLDDKLDNFGDELTFVAPTNDAFTALGDAVLDSLRAPENQQDLVNILEYHIIIGVFTLSELVDVGSLPTEQGTPIVVSATVSVGPQGLDITEFMLNNRANVLASPDGGRGSLLANNGVFYKIDAVLRF